MTLAVGEAQRAFPARPAVPVADAPASTAGHAERDALHARFADRLIVRRELSRRLVSYQGNRAQPGLRWLRYKEGFAAGLARGFLDVADGPVLDPFAGIGTTALVAGSAGREATGIEIMPVGVRVARAISLVAGGVDAGAVETAGRALLAALRGGPADAAFRFPHVPITERAFSPETEDAIAKARAFLATLAEPLRTVLDVACMSVLEDVSYTRKDGQYLRWDDRCGRALRGSMDKGPIPSFAEALEQRLGEVLADAPELARRYGGRPPRLIAGSALRELANLPDDSVGLTITSPPYDYTRTYALELAWLGYDKPAFGALRQALISATVENRSKDREARFTFGPLFWRAEGCHSLITIPPKLEFPPYDDTLAFRVAGTASCLYLRAEPGGDRTIRDCLPDGTRLLLSESSEWVEASPAARDPSVAWWERPWVYVRTDDGADGWVALEYLNWY